MKPAKQRLADLVWKVVVIVLLLVAIYIFFFVDLNPIYFPTF
jgi:hypothetical protein